MQYPLISEYIEAIRSAEDNFDKLANLCPVLDDNGNPIMSSGNFAVVFKMRDVSTGRLFAVKCFIKEQEGRGERYAKITDELQFVSSPYILHVQYIDRELFVNTTNCDEEEFPVLVMDWVDGQPLDAYLRENLDDEYVLQMLAYRFCNMGAWLLSQPFAHGDLKPDNILVRDDGTLVLVDYDGMYVPSMKGEKAYEIGSPDFRHPQRTAYDFDEHIDDFSIASIALSLKAISFDSSLYGIYSESDRLLFSENDYFDISQSIALQNILTLSSNNELATILSLFLLAISKRDLNMVSFRLLILKEPERNNENLLSSKITDEERRKAVIDDYLVEYTKDWSKLITAPKDITTYTVNERCKVIADGAFRECKNLKSITFPIGLLKIGNNAFTRCSSLQSILIPKGTKYIGNFAFCECGNLGVCIIHGVKHIGDWAFGWCGSLHTIDVPNTVLSIGDYAFCCCSSIGSIEIPNGVTHIGKSAFASTSIKRLLIPRSVKFVGCGAFNCCSTLNKLQSDTQYYKVNSEILISSSNEVISCLSSSKHIVIPHGVVEIGETAFHGCGSLISIDMPNTVKRINDYAFAECKSLQSISIPNGVISIGNFAFVGCESLKSMYIPKGIISIGDYAFSGCFSLQDIFIDSTTVNIGSNVFSECYSLKHIYVTPGTNEQYINLLGEQFREMIVELHQLKI